MKLHNLLFYLYKYLIHIWRHYTPRKTHSRIIPIDIPANALLLALALSPSSTKTDARNAKALVKKKLSNSNDHKLHLLQIHVIEK